MDQLDEEIKQIMYTPTSAEEKMEGRQAIYIMIKIFAMILGALMAVDVISILLFRFGVI